MGAGILEDEYVQALRPLQDGVPPRSLAAVRQIIETSVGMPMDDLFAQFDPVPLGAASIAQAHRATLLDGREVVVKVQYPEVASLYAADFDNLELVTRFLFPENVQLVRGLRRRHQAELDFRQEASNLHEVGDNLRRRGLEPRLVRVPTVPDARLCTQHVLAMELLRGVSLASAIEQERADIARALGISSHEELRMQLMHRMRDHFEQGGGARHMLIDAVVAAAPIVRAYAAAARHVRRSLVGLYNVLARCVQACGVALPQLAPAASDDATRPDLGQALRVLIRVHGCAMLLDGVYNADPHPGNVLLLPDGRLGLIDYGMVGRLGREERECIARVILALAANDRSAVVGEYERAGYRACWHSGVPHGEAAIHRFATFHLDRIDMSPVSLGGEAGDVQTIPIMALLRSTIEHSVPDWVEQARRLGGLLIGVASQVARPVSLAHEWAPIASVVVPTADGMPCTRARLQTQLTGVIERYH